MDLGDGSDVPKGEEFGRGGGKGEMQAWERVGQGIRYTDGKNATIDHAEVVRDE